MLKWIKRIFVAIFGLILLTVLVLWIGFYSWKKKVIADLPNDSKTLTTKNGVVEYILEGNSDRVMLVVHGRPGSVHISKIDGSFYLDKGFSVLSVSRPGYYQTPLSSGKTAKEQAALYVSLLDELGIDSVYVNGVSGGGPSSIQFAIDYPERCAGLILRAAVAERIEPEKDDKGLLAKFFETEFGTWMGIQIALLKYGEKAKIIEQYAKLAMLPFEKSKEGNKNDGIQFNAIGDFEFEKIEAPTIIFHGNKDTAVPFSHAQKAAESIPKATLVEMEGKTHSVFLTSYADTINATIVDFVDGKKIEISK